jgi:hypothetical protein
MQTSFEVLQFCQAIKASKKRSQPKDKTPKIVKKLKTQDAEKEVVAQQQQDNKKKDDEADDDDIERIFMDDFFSSGFFNHSF